MKLLGILLILVSLVMNPFVVRQFSPDKDIQHESINYAIVFGEMIFLLVGLFILLVNANDRMGTWFRKNKLNFLVLFVSLTVCVMVVLLFYIHFIYGKTAWQDPNTEFNMDLGWTPIANRNTIAFGDKVLSSNSMGFRSDEVDNSKDHILILGDSVAWGYGVGDNETISYYLQRYLDEDYNNFQVLNLGVSGFGIDQYYLYLKKNIDELNPKKIIIIVYAGNDFDESGRDSLYGKSKPLLIHEGGKIQSVNLPLSRYSCMNLIPDFVRGLGEKICGERKLSHEKTDELVRELLNEIDRITRENNAELFFVISSSKKDYNQKTKSLIYFQEFFENEDYEYLDFYKEIKNSDLSSDELYVDIAHYSPEGNDYLAKTLYNRLEWEKG